MAKRKGIFVPARTICRAVRGYDAAARFEIIDQYSPYLISLCTFGGVFDEHLYQTLRNELFFKMEKLFPEVEDLMVYIQMNDVGAENTLLDDIFTEVRKTV